MGKTIAVDQPTYDRLLSEKSYAELGELGVSKEDFQWRLTVYQWVASDANLNDAWKAALKGLVHVDAAAAHPDAETDPAFIAQWTAWMEEQQ